MYFFILELEYQIWSEYIRQLLDEAMLDCKVSDVIDERLLRNLCMGSSALIEFEDSSVDPEVD